MTKPLTQFALAAATLSLLSPFALAANPVLTEMDAITANNQLVLYLSEPTSGHFTQPDSGNAGQRTYLLDLDDVRVPKMSNKDALLRDLQKALPGIGEITLSEFQGAQPMVRLMIKTSSPDVGATVSNTDGKKIIIQLSGPGMSNQQPEFKQGYIGTRPSVPMDRDNNQQFKPNYAPAYTPTTPPAYSSSLTADPNNSSGLVVPKSEPRVATTSPRWNPAPYEAKDRSEDLTSTYPNSNFNNFSAQNKQYSHSYPEVNGSDRDEQYGSNLPVYATREKYVNQIRNNPPSEDPRYNKGIKLNAPEGDKVSDPNYGYTSRNTSTGRIDSQTDNSIASNNYSNTNTAFTSQTAINNNSISGYTTGDLKTRVLQLEDSMRALQAENAQLRQQLQNMGNQ